MKLGHSQQNKLKSTTDVALRLSANMPGTNKSNFPQD